MKEYPCGWVRVAFWNLSADNERALFMARFVVPLCLRLKCGKSWDKNGVYVIILRFSFIGIFFLLFYLCEAKRDCYYRNYFQISFRIALPESYIDGIHTFIINRIMNILYIYIYSTVVVPVCCICISLNHYCYYHCNLSRLVILNQGYRSYEDMLSHVIENQFYTHSSSIWGKVTMYRLPFFFVFEEIDW